MAQTVCERWCGVGARVARLVVALIPGCCLPWDWVGMARPFSWRVVSPGCIPGSSEVVEHHREKLRVIHPKPRLVRTGLSVCRGVWFPRRGRTGTHLAALPYRAAAHVLLTQLHHPPSLIAVRIRYRGRGTGRRGSRRRRARCARTSIWSCRWHREAVVSTRTASQLI